MGRPWHWRFLTFSVVASIGLWVGLGQPEASPSTPEDPEVDSIAVVDGEEISLERFNQLWRNEVARLRMRDGHVPGSLAKAQKAALAERLIHEALIEHAAEQEQLTVDTQTLDRAFASRKRPSEMTSDEALRNRIRLDMLAEQIVERRVPQSFPEDALQAFFERNPDRFQVSSHLDVEDLRVAVPAEATAAEVSARAQEASALREQARTKATLSGGETVRLTAAQVPPEVWEQLNALSLQETSPVLRTEQGFHVFRLKARGPSVIPPYAAVKARVPAVMRSLLLDLRRSGLMDELRSSAVIQNHLATRQSLDAQAPSAPSSDFGHRP
jgi:peptidyl-prolyl cis-trans isomerase C